MAALHASHGFSGGCRVAVVLVPPDQRLSERQQGCITAIQPGPFSPQVYPGHLHHQWHENT